MTNVLKAAWRLTPDDAVRIALVAVAMPLLFLAYRLAWDQQSARLVFSLCVGALGILVGYLIQERRDIMGYFIGSCAIGSTIAALGSLFAIDDPTWTWRTVMAGSQGNVVLGWLILWRVRQKWLSRTLAWWAFLVSAAGFGLYIVGNFGLPDPTLANPWTWGWTQPKGILARTLSFPWEAVLMVGLWTAIALTLRRFLIQHGPSDRC